MLPQLAQTHHLAEALRRALPAMSQLLQRGLFPQVNEMLQTVNYSYKAKVGPEHTHQILSLRQKAFDEGIDPFRSNQVPVKTSEPQNHLPDFTKLLSQLRATVIAACLTEHSDGWSIHSKDHISESTLEQAVTKVLQFRQHHGKKELVNARMQEMQEICKDRNATGTLAKLQRLDVRLKPPKSQTQDRRI